MRSWPTSALRNEASVSRPDDLPERSALGYADGRNQAMSHDTTIEFPGDACHTEPISTLTHIEPPRGGSDEEEEEA